MARTKKTPSSPTAPVRLSAIMSRRPTFKGFKTWIVGDSPLITHAWSEKAKRQMLSTQVKATKAGKEARDPEADYLSSLYDMGDSTYGFPATGVKNAILSVAHKDKGIPRTTVQASLFIQADIVRVRPALAGAVCDMPLLRIYGDNPEMREDMVNVGGGLNKKASLSYRGQFTTWAMQVNGMLNEDVMPMDSLAFLINEAGLSVGVGEWRNEKRGMFGAFHLASATEEEAWDAFAAGAGPLPEREQPWWAMAAE